MDRATKLQVLLKRDDTGELVVLGDVRPTFMDIREFRDKGYLQEVNRQFFHPLGLALCVVCPAEGEGKLTDNSKVSPRFN